MNQFLLDSFVSYCKLLDAEVKQQFCDRGIKYMVDIELERLSDVMQDAMDNRQGVCFSVAVENCTPATVYFDWDGTLAGMIVGADPERVLSSLERYTASVVRFLPAC